MSSRNPTIVRSPRAPKLKELETGEGSSPRTVRQLGYVPRTDLIVKTTKKKVFIQPLTFGDTEASTESKLSLPQWGDLFNRISREEKLEYVPCSDPDVRALDEQVFPNIQWSYLHMVVRRTPICPYIEVLKWLINHMDEHKCLINDEQGGCIRFFLPTEVEKYYKLRDPEEWLNTEFMVKFYEIHDTSRLMTSWWREDKKFTNQSSGWYGTINSRDPYLFLMALIFRLYGEKDCSKFLEA
jgi:hypothetical protein